MIAQSVPIANQVTPADHPLASTEPTAQTREQARAEIATSRMVFDRLTAGGQEGQTDLQGMGNYYQTDPLDRANFERFIDGLLAQLPRLGNRVLVAGCGDGALETELLIRAEFEVVTFDFSPGAVDVARTKLTKLGLQAQLFVDDVTDLTLDRYEADFAGVMFAQVAAFIPIVEGDALLVKAINDLVSLLAPGGMFEFSTTRYPETLGRGAIDAVYYGRSNEALVAIIEQAGITITHQEFFDAATAWPGKETYQNQYIIGRKHAS